MARELTMKQKIFVQEYIVDFNAAAAARRAGYAVKNADKIGAQLLDKNWVSAAIEKELKKRKWRTEIKAEEVIRDLIEIKERCLQRVPVTDRKGNQICDEEGNAIWAFDAKEANKSLELLGKHLGLFTDNKVDLSGGLDVRISYVDSGKEDDDGDDS